MSRAGSRLARIYAAILLIALIFGVRGIGAAQAEGAADTLYSYMVQSQCVGADGQAAIGISPLTNACHQLRKLQPGEPLAYHKQDWPGLKDAVSTPGGYQRSDSYPFVSPAWGRVVVQTFDFGAGKRAFGRFDDPADGGQIVAFSAADASFILTQDGGRGLQLMAGPSCSGGQVSATALLGSWVIARTDGSALAPGTAVATLRIVTDSACPTGFDHAFTRWYFTDLRYRMALDGARSAPLHTLVSDHFGGEDPSSAGHLERFYFTRELGLTRWERWQNIASGETPERKLEAARRLTVSHRCEALEPAPGADWTMVDCREWTDIVAPETKAGDPPGFWLTQLRTSPLIAALGDAVLGR